MTRSTLIALALTSFLAAGCENGMFGSKDKSDTTVRRRQDVSSNALPASVKQSFDKDHPGATVNDVTQKSYSNGATGYKITYTTSDGKSQTAEYNAKGQLAQ